MFDLDTSLFLWLNASASSPHWVVPLARLASLELPQYLIAGTVGALIVGDAQVRRAVWRIALAMAVAWLIARLAQHLWPMPRPFMLGLGTAWLPHADASGFPSTHTSVAFAFAAAVAASTRQRIARVAAFAAAGLVAWSRISLGLHFPFDVLAGMAVGLFGAWAVSRLAELSPALQTVTEQSAAPETH